MNEETRRRDIQPVSYTNNKLEAKNIINWRFDIFYLAHNTSHSGEAVNKSSHVYYKHNEEFKTLNYNKYAVINIPILAVSYFLCKGTQIFEKVPVIREQWAGRLGASQPLHSPHYCLLYKQNNLCARPSLFIVSHIFL